MLLPILEEERAGIIATTADYKAAVLADSPTLLYMMDEPSGTQVVDSSGNGNHNVYRAGYTLAQPGIISGYNCPDFVAGYAYGNSNIAALNTNTVSFSVVVSIDLTTGGIVFHTGEMIGVYQGYFLLIGTDGSVQFRTYSGGAWRKVATVPGAIPTGTPVHIGFAYNNLTGGSIMLINGSAPAVTEDSLGTYGLATSITPLYVCCRRYSGAPNIPCTGKIAGLAIFAGQALSAAQLQAHFNATGI